MEFGLKKKGFMHSRFIGGGSGSALSFKVGISTVSTRTRSYYLLQAGGECFCVFQYVAFVFKLVLCLLLSVK